MDLSPIVTDAISVVSLVLVPIAGLLANKAISVAEKKFGLQVSQADEAAIDKAVSAGAGMLRAKLATGQMALPEVIFGNKHVEEVAETALDIAGAAGNATNITKAEIAARIVGAVGHALGEDPGVTSVARITPPQPAKVAGPLTTAAILLCLGAVGLVACGTPAQQQAACQTDTALVPIADGTLSTLVPASAGIVSLDTLLVHPAVVNYCKSLGGTPAAAAVAAASAPIVSPAPPPAAATPAAAN